MKIFSPLAVAAERTNSLIVVCVYFDCSSAAAQRVIFAGRFYTAINSRARSLCGNVKIGRCAHYLAIWTRHFARFFPLCYRNRRINRVVAVSPMPRRLMREKTHTTLIYSRLRALCIIPKCDAIICCPIDQIYIWVFS